MSINTGGPAFPKAGNEFSEMEWVPAAAESGMTLRDYFAAKAMQSQMLNTKEMDYWAQDYSVNEMWIFCAKNAYRMADAMLKVRNQ